MGAIIEQCHAQGIKVVAWYLPGFTNLAKDYARSKAAIHFRSAAGQKFDSFTLDIEATTVKDATSRTKPPADPLQPHPRGRRQQLPARRVHPVAGRHGHAHQLLAGLPVQTLAGIYDVFVPMGYYTYHGDGYANAYRDTRDNIRIIREQTGVRPSPST